MIGQRISHYHVFERIGAGGMGEVYRARDEHLNRDVAVKVLPEGTLKDDHARKRFRQEAEALSRLNHPHIATIFDFDTERGVDFLVMEFVSGTTLSEKLLEGPLPETEAIRLGTEIAAALEEAHEQGVIHRDLKPANIGLTSKDQVKVFDFGLAKLLPTLSDTMTTEERRESASLAGTLGYIAPEQLRGARPDRRSDLYALGVVLYQITTGQAPFEHEIPTALVDMILHQAPTPPRKLNPELSAGLEAVILKCLEKDPARRYSSAAEVLGDLKRLGSPSSILVSAPPFVRKWSLAVAVVLAAWASFFFLFKPDASFPTPESVSSIVALPTKVLAPEEEQFLTDAIPEVISTHVASVEDLVTKVPPPSVEVERVGGNLTKIAKAYSVDALVLSSVTMDADRLMLSVQLVDARDLRLLWSREFKGNGGGYLSLARRAAQELQVAMRPSSPARSRQEVLKPSREAQMAFQRGLYSSRRYNHLHHQEDFERAQALFKETLATDPQYASAAAEMAWLYVYRMESGAPPEESLDHIESWARRASLLDSQNGQAWSILAFLQVLDPNVKRPEALRAALKALSGAPRDGRAYVTLGAALSACSYRLSREVFLEAVSVDPLYLYPTLDASVKFAYLGDTERGLELVNQALELEPNMPLGLVSKLGILTATLRTEEALTIEAQLERLVESGAVPREWFDEINDLLLIDQGKVPDVEATLKKRAEEAVAAPPDSSIPMLEWLGRRGESELALDILARRYERGAAEPYDWLASDPAFDAIRDDPRFQKTLERARTQYDEVMAVLLEARSRGELPAFLDRAVQDLSR